MLVLFMRKLASYSLFSSVNLTHTYTRGCRGKQNMLATPNKLGFSFLFFTVSVLKISSENFSRGAVEDQLLR